MSPTFLMREEVDWNGSLVLIAFPTAGNAGNIAGHYLRKRLDLPLVGSIHLESDQGAVTVENGRSMAPLRIYGGEVECYLGEGRCPTIHLIVTDLPLSPAATAAVTDAIMENTKGCTLLLCLDAVVRAADDETPDVFCASPNPTISNSLQKQGVRPLPNGILVGMSGHILLKAEQSGLPAGALLVEATPDLPDGRAAAALVAAVDHLIPQVKVDPVPLEEEAQELEKMVRQAQKDVESHERHGPFTSFI